MNSKDLEKNIDTNLDTKIEKDFQKSKKIKLWNNYILIGGYIFCRNPERRISSSHPAPPPRCR